MPLVLVIDDNPAVREFVGVVLEQAGYQVRLVPDGAAGITSVREEPPDAVVLDLKMPGMDGKQVLSSRLPLRDRPLRLCA